ncbi:phage tail protein [Phormidium sp. CLA17]|uniref:phage tail protein n=1 Tax=Leptolyngbya sp. Cla-17 TaxID=2803751 RepID=UPI0014912EDF|nr:phage tail protein [Leptolyngbya sp. Cla-17]MBM0740393.1 phage tail protein [Leptolyngbya sp. Cla-17]
MVASRIFTTFNFLVEISVPGVSTQICKAEFAECDGLELSMEPKTFHQGGLNTEQVHLAGPISYGQLTLKRGMSKDFGLWRWFTEVMKTKQRGLRGQATIVMLDGAQQKQITFKLKDCLPIKLRVPALNAKEGGIAIEELQLVYAAMEVDFDSSQLGLNVQASVGVSAQASIGLS